MKSLYLFAAICAFAFGSTAKTQTDAPITSNPSPSPNERPIEHNSTLDERSPSTEGRRHEDVVIPLQAGQRVSISVESDEFDPIVEIYRRLEEPMIARDDDSGSGFNSLLMYTPSESGEYVVRVRSYVPDDRGRYRLVIAPTAPLPPAVSLPEARTVMNWREYEGNLARPAVLDPRGPFIDHLIHLDADAEVILRADSEIFDPVLDLLSATGRESDPLETDDDSGPGTNSMLIYRPSATGDYIIRVRSFGGGLGSYVLRVGTNQSGADRPQGGQTE